jgi:hypothetical protein
MSTAAAVQAAAGQLIRFTSRNLSAGPASAHRQSASSSPLNPPEASLMPYLLAHPNPHAKAYWVRG